MKTTKPDLKQFGCKAEMVKREYIAVIGPKSKSTAVRVYLQDHGFCVTRSGPIGDGTPRFRHIGYRDIDYPEVV